jgi:hypothetical protein
MKRSLPLLIIFAALCSCAGYKVLTLVNDGPYSKVYRMSGNFIPVDKKALGPYGNFQIAAETKVASADSAISYCLIVGCLARNGFFINEGQSLSVNIDGRQIQLTRNPTPYKQKDMMFKWDRYVMEMAWFDVDKNVLKNLNEASTVEFVVKGKHSSIAGSLTKQNLENLKAFYAQYVE